VRPRGLAQGVTRPGGQYSGCVPGLRSVAVVTLGCARNEVDSEELAGRLEAAGWRLVADAQDADVAVVNTCGFVEQAKKDSIDVLMEASQLRDSGEARTRAVVAVGCLAERYGEQLAQALPEADAVLGFDSYTELSGHLDAVLRGERPASHVPRDRRTLLPLAPAARATVTARAAGTGANGRLAVRPDDPNAALDGDPAAGTPDLPAGVAPATGPRVVRARLDGRPWAPLKLASGCDRRCSFCAIPAFRGAFLSRRPAEVLTEARWLAERGVRELFLVSENSTSYGKDLGDLRLLETLLPELAAVDGIDRVRVSYLQPAELRPGLIDALTGTEGVAPYFDLSFQHASTPLLRRMRRFGGTDDFLSLLERIRAQAPPAGVRSNVIVGFPGETDDDLAELERFVEAARLDVVGVFGYSDEDGTEAAGFDGKLPDHEVSARVAKLSALVEELTAQRAEERVGEVVDVLVEGMDDDEPDTPFGRAAHQGPEVDGVTLLPGVDASAGQWVRAVVTTTAGVDLIARPVGPSSSPFAGFVAEPAG
jgi:ribosomal protein S12 methylthiotransferase